MNLEPPLDSLTSIDFCGDHHCLDLSLEEGSEGQISDVADIDT